MEIRELKTKDIKVIAKMLGKINQDSVNNLLKLIRQAKLKKSNDSMEIGFTLFQILAADLTDDIFEWFADLAGMTVEELDEMPIDTPKLIVTTLMKRGNFGDFLASASQQAETPKA